MIKSISSPGIEAYFRTETADGMRVNGHRSRTTALLQELEPIITKSGIPKKSIYIFDGTSNLYDLGIGDLAVGILDTTNQNQSRYNVVVSHHPGAYLFDLDENDHQLKLLGPDYLLVQREWQYVYPIDKGYIAYVPGGNQHKFWEPLGDINKHHPGIIVENYSIGEVAKIIAGASIVICSASTVALEAAALGKRMLMVQTAEDQQPIIDGLEWLGYKDFVFTEELFRNWRQLEPIKIGNRFGAKRVAQVIYEEANK